MNVRDFLIILILFFAPYWIGMGCEPLSSLRLLSSDHPILYHGSRLMIHRVPILCTQFQSNDFGIRLLVVGNDDDDDKIVSISDAGAAAITTTTRTPMNLIKRNRRDISASMTKRQMNNNNSNKFNDIGNSNALVESSFQEDEVGWSNINAEVDIIIPMILKHLQKLNVEYLQLPFLRETISVTPLFINYEAGLNLSNGIAYGLKGIRRFDDAFMTYSTDKSFLCKFNIIIKQLQFEYDFLIKLMAIEGYGRVTGSLEDTVIFGELGISVIDARLKLHDFRVTSFRNIQVQLDQHHIIRELSGAILSPITNLFRDRITTSISDGLKEQIQLVMDDFNDKDPLQLKTFAKQILAGLTKE